MALELVHAVLGLEVLVSIPACTTVIGKDAWLVSLEVQKISSAPQELEIRVLVGAQALSFDR